MQSPASCCIRGSHPDDSAKPSTKPTMFNGGHTIRHQIDQGRVGKERIVAEEASTQLPAPSARHDSLRRLCLRRSDYREGTKAGHGAHREAVAHPQLRICPPIKRYLWLVGRGRGEGWAVGHSELGRHPPSLLCCVQLCKGWSQHPTTTLKCVHLPALPCFQPSLLKRTV
jgi:hypothetical protein